MGSGAAATAPRIVCILMNTFGILPEQVRLPALEQMWEVAGSGQVIIGCWHRPSLPVGFADLYSKNPKLVGAAATEEMCDYAAGNFLCPESGYSSHWWTEAELDGYLRKSAPGAVSIEFLVIGVG